VRTVGEIGHAGYKSRPVRENDPLVCDCGMTIGTQALKRDAGRLKEIVDQHAPAHRRRLAHQVRHRGAVSSCPECPEVGNA
jgi:hypothetical protein